MGSTGNPKPERYGKYELLERIGAGGMAEVYLARQAGVAGFQKSVVIKRVLPQYQGDPRFIEMFLDEARLAARLTHPNICQVFDLGEAQGTWYLAMEHVPGLTLTEVLSRLRSRGAKLPQAAALRVTAQLCEALHYAHSLAGDDGRPLKIVHRDVTPSNVMLSPQGTVKLLDFGIARAVGRTHRTQVGIAKGKLGFMAPEQVRAEVVTNRTDIFAAGAVLYLMLTGRRAYGERPVFPEAFEAMANARFPPPRQVAPEVDVELERIVLKAMAREPEDRYATAFELLADLEAFASRAGVSMGPQVLSELMVQLTVGAAEEQQGSAESAGRTPGPILSPGDTLIATVQDLPSVTGRRAAGPPMEIDQADILTSTSETLPPSAARLRGAAPARGKAPMVLAGLAALAVLAAAAVAWLPGAFAPPEAGAADAGRQGAPAQIVAGEVKPSARAEQGGRGAAPEATRDAGIASAGSTSASAASAETATADAGSAGVQAEAPERSGSREPKVDEHHATPAPTESAANTGRPRVRQRTTGGPSLRRPKHGEKTGTLSVITEPDARVHLDGEAAGTSPLQLELPVGRYRVRLEYPGAPPRELLVNVSEGKLTLVKDRQ